MRRRHLQRLQALLLFLIGLIASTFLLAGSRHGPEEQWRRALIVTGHPDDEAMFFAPAILSLTKVGVELFALCLSAGNANGLGSIRQRELYDSYNHLGLPATHVKIVDDPLLVDGMQIEWAKEAINIHVKKSISDDGPFDAILTFDEHGISQHLNHRSIHHALVYLSQSDQRLKKRTRLYVLHTIPFYIKYLSLPMAILRHYTPIRNPLQRLHFLLSTRDYLIAIQAMFKHRSQLVWFRYVYITMSTYMYNNEFILVE